MEYCGKFDISLDNRFNCNKPIHCYSVPTPSGASLYNINSKAKHKHFIDICFNFHCIHYRILLHIFQHSFPDIRVHFTTAYTSVFDYKNAESPGVYDFKRKRNMFKIHIQNVKREKRITLSLIIIMLVFLFCQTTSAVPYVLHL